MTVIAAMAMKCPNTKYFVQRGLNMCHIFHWVIYNLIATMNLKQLRSISKLLIAIDDPYSLRVVQIHLKFEHFFDIISILFISKKSVQYHCRWNLKQLRSSWKLLIAIDDPYSLRVVQIHFKFEHFFEIISILVISKKIYPISLKLQPKPGVIKMKITQWNIWHISIQSSMDKTLHIWTFLWNYLYIRHLKEICLILL